MEKKETIVLTPEEEEYIKLHYPNLPMSVPEWSKRFYNTPEEIKEIASVPQGTPEWLEFRKYRITGSVYGAAIGENPYETPQDLIKTNLWPKPMDDRGKRYCKWGNDHEDDACDAYEEYMRWQKGLRGDQTDFWVDHYGLDVHPDEPWSGDSKDGVVCDVQPDGTIKKWLLEIKCPVKKEFGQHKGKFMLYEYIPPYYYAQIQGIMGFNNFPYCDFVVWNPEEMLIERYHFDPEYYQWFRKTMREWYVKEFAPRAILRDHGLLKEGEIDLATEIEMDANFMEANFKGFSKLFEHRQPDRSKEESPPKKKPFISPFSSLSFSSSPTPTPLGPTMIKKGPQTLHDLGFIVKSSSKETTPPTTSQPDINKTSEKKVFSVKDMGFM